MRDAMDTVIAEPGIVEHFVELGCPEHVGLAFAISPKRTITTEPVDVATLPNPDYEHRVYHDLRSDCLVVLRADAKGEYPGMDDGDFKDLKDWKRVR